VDESPEAADEKLGVATMATNELLVISTDEQYCTGVVRSLTWFSFSRYAIHISTDEKGTGVRPGKFQIGIPAQLCVVSDAR
jgi:hypothetical protein